MAAPDEAFLAGFAHDLGLLVEAHVWPAELRAVLAETADRERPFGEVERRRLGTDHAVLGCGLASKWRLPGFCRAACRHHHRPEAAREHLGVVAVVHAADVLACDAGIGLDLTAAHQHLKPQDAKAVHVDSDATDALRQALPGLLDELDAAG